ncbi:HamA C-terminal domain-containing protein [Acinetobacter baumannii]|uniref:HamA C-terminal domain-containing protein n=1 Tax=Acinetobacter baumannii TaxID=470 RepID=UPI00201D253E|nr:DUF1837 domain-containing protein [Acinetobacter baumannii]MCL6695255.1 DUF1837 domain-containing protein [Acinetobacter baumannii]
MMGNQTLLAMPDPFLEVRVHKTDLDPNLLTMCAGYELGEWRETQFADHVMQWLPEFALNYQEVRSMSAHNAVALLQKAARSIYQTDKYQSRGEFGELILHIILRQFFKTIPAISKIFFKDSRNDTVKGFDSVHVVYDGNTLDLYLGEVKFYTNINRAISDVIAELEIHTRGDYLRSEFTAILNKIDAEFPLATELRDLLHANKSLDTIIDSLVIPVLLTYESDTISQFNRVTEDFKEALEKEVNDNWEKFSSKGLPQDFRIELILLPLKSKKSFIECLDGMLDKWK